MKLSKDLATGTIAGAMGFFASRMPGVSPITQGLSAGAMTAFSTAFLYQHPLFNTQNIPQNHYAMIVGTLLPLSAGFALQYGIGTESYITNPVVMALTLLVNHIVNIKNQEVTIYTELQEWANIQLEAWNRGLQRVELDPPANVYGTLEKANENMYTL